MSLAVSSKFDRMQANEVWEVSVIPEGEEEGCILKLRILQIPVNEDGKTGARVEILKDTFDPCISAGTTFIDQETLEGASIIETV